MMQISREIRFALVDKYHGTVTNSWGGWPATSQIAPQLKLQCVIAGQPDVMTGYVCNIADIDEILRKTVTRNLIPNFHHGDSAENVIRLIYDGCQKNWGLDNPIVSLVLFLTPYLSYSIHAKDSRMIELTQQFEFSASHRLHCAQLSDDENRAMFGKCNNLEGHGHNYVVEVSVTGKVDGTTGQLIELHELEKIVKDLVIDRLDHKHLNRDVEYFDQLNPSVENITSAIWNWLEGQFGSARLSNVKVYETPKTWAQITE